MLRIFTSVKIQRLRPGLNPQTWVPEVSMLTTRPTKPSPVPCTGGMNVPQRYITLSTEPSLNNKLNTLFHWYFVFRRFTPYVFVKPALVSLFRSIVDDKAVLF